jgi:DNA (cytosine-5)-methyltransferase 1
MRKLTSIEGFCGAGGMALGFKKAGFDSLLAFDCDAAAISTYEKNIGPEGKVLDARQLKGSEVLRSLGLDKGELDLFAGGPPCQGFSLQRRRGYESDERNDLVWDYFRLVEEMLPRAFLLENVVMLGKLRGHKYTRSGFARLTDLGYKISSGIVNCADYGMAQTRKRFIAVGIRSEQHFQFPQKVLLEGAYSTVREAIGDLPDCPEDFTEHSSLANHIRCRITQKNLEMISHVPQGGGWKDIPQHLWLDCMKRWKGASGGWPDVYGRLAWNGQCPTITAGFDSFSRGRYAHPKYHRAITPREAARLQTFPDNFRFTGTRHDVRLQIGNAVPPLLAEVFGKAIKAVLIGKKTKVADARLYAKCDKFVPRNTQTQSELWGREWAA